MQHASLEGSSHFRCVEDPPERIHKNYPRNARARVTTRIIFQPRINTKNREERKSTYERNWTKNCVPAMEWCVVVAHWTRVYRSTRCWCVHCDMSGGDFRLSGRTRRELVATWTDRAARTDAEEGSRDRWSMTPVWIRARRACVGGVCQERKKSGSKRGESERGTAGIRAVAWLGSDWAESTEGFRCAFTLRAFLSFPLPFLRHAFHLARARGRLVLFTLLIVIAWTVT